MRKVSNVAAAAVLLLGTSACDLLGSNKKAEKTVTTTKAKVQNKLCASNATYQRLKESAFDEAKRIREKDTEALDALADASIVRMENPLLESRDEALGLTVCSGRMVLELPPGAGASFDGRQRLAADVTYSAQAAADGSGTVFKIDGGEPIVYRLASFDPARSSTRTASLEPVGLDKPDAVQDVAPPPPPPPLLPTDQDRVKADRARAEAERAERLAQAERAAVVRRREAIATARAREAAVERAAAAERVARDERVAEARRVDRGEQSRRGPATAARPSFNCRYARSRIERRICGSEELAARDRAMASLFYRTNDRADPAVRRRLSASRLRFLAYRDRCPDDACVAAAYEDRMDEIRDIAAE